ncbi:MAG TPA: UDP-2,3-diacylglucosamine diphosphatase [Phycisphaerales bacterium]|nr:UDP-2,3-diacylglucosamine diphosphatase [Phycisphaerales bacterium]HMP38314.1 UDP-2,3-diacylglucosamine diphosphatase [Phycisphaerales bacterium]
MPMHLACRTAFISDTHLGSRGCRAQELARFLKLLRCERIYLVGDIIDMWRLRSRWYWPAEHNEVVRRILKIAKRGTEVIFVPGNHDEAARQFHHLEFGGVKLMPRAIHETADGRRFLVTHGDQYDLVVRHHPVLSGLGSAAYEVLIGINRVYNGGRRLIGLPYWSLSQYLKLKVKSACTFISRFEQTLIEEATRQRLDGVVCGHIHKAEIREGLRPAYYNCGDWIESCTALVEHHDGRMELVAALPLLDRLGPAVAPEAAADRDEPFEVVVAAEHEMIEVGV